tara:strand:+ start:2449 stop:2712 length:264 start_codon:yes stop_codon:yes gene_type:complete
MPSATATASLSHEWSLASSRLLDVWKRDKTGLKQQVTQPEIVRTVAIESINGGHFDGYGGVSENRSGLKNTLRSKNNQISEQVMLWL